MGRGTGEAEGEAKGDYRSGKRLRVLVFGSKRLDRGEGGRGTGEYAWIGCVQIDEHGPDVELSGLLDLTSVGYAELAILDGCSTDSFSEHVARILCFCSRKQRLHSH